MLSTSTGLSLGILDLIVIATGLMVTYAFAFRGGRFGDQLLTARRLTLPFFVTSLVATWYGGIFGVTEIAFRSGIYNFVTQGIFWYIVYLFFAFFLVKRLHRSGWWSVHQIAEQRIGKKARMFTLALSVFNVLPITYVLGLATLLQLTFGWDLSFAMFVGSMAMLGYSMRGGFGAVVYSDGIQCIAMCASVMLVIIFSFQRFGGIDELVLRLPPSHWQLTSEESPLMVFSWLIVACATLIDPCFYQRVFACRDDQIAKKGMIVATLVWVIFDLCTTFGAMYAAAYLPQAQPRFAYVLYAVEILPDGLRGFFVFGMVSLILSTLDSFVHVGSRLLTDAHPSLAQKKWQGWLFEIAIVSIAILLAHVYDGSFKRIWKSVGGMVSVFLLVPMMFVLFTNRRLDEKYFLGTCLLIGCTTLVWNWTDASSYFGIEDLYVGLGMSIIGTILANRADGAENPASGSDLSNT